MVDDYGWMILEAKRNPAEGEEPKQKLESEPSTGKTKRKKSPLKLEEEFINKTKNDEKI